MSLIVKDDFIIIDIESKSTKNNYNRLKDILDDLEIKKSKTRFNIYDKAKRFINFLRHYSVKNTVINSLLNAKISDDCVESTFQYNEIVVRLKYYINFKMQVGIFEFDWENTITHHTYTRKFVSETTVYRADKVISHIFDNVYHTLLKKSPDTINLTSHLKNLSIF